MQGRNNLLKFGCLLLFDHNLYPLPNTRRDLLERALRVLQPGSRTRQHFWGGGGEENQASVSHQLQAQLQKCYISFFIFIFLFLMAFETTE